MLWLDLYLQFIKSQNLMQVIIKENNTYKSMYSFKE
jgi:hypothetical protein